MDSRLQTKLQGFSAQPPESVWGKIADALDAEGPFAHRLHQYEETPPARAWNKIEQGLNTPAPAKDVSILTRFKKPLRYAAAASIIAVVLVTVTLSVKRTEAGAIEPGSDATVPTANAGSKTGSSTKKEINALKAESSSQNVAESTTNKTTTQATYSSFNEYVFFDDGDGKKRRVSKKLAALVHCKDNDVACQQRLQQLRQKLAANAMTTDFTGVLEMMRQLQ